jgi:hypothetical protein
MICNINRLASFNIQIQDPSCDWFWSQQSNHVIRDFTDIFNIHFWGPPANAHRIPIHPQNICFDLLLYILHGFKMDVVAHSDGLTARYRPQYMLLTYLP